MNVLPGNRVSDAITSQNIFTSYFITEMTLSSWAVVSRQSVHTDSLTNFRWLVTIKPNNIYPPQTVRPEVKIQYNYPRLIPKRDYILWYRNISTITIRVHWVSVICTAANVYFAATLAPLHTDTYDRCPQVTQQYHPKCIKFHGACGMATIAWTQLAH